MSRSSSTRGGVASRLAGVGIAALVRAVRLVRSPRPIHSAGVVVRGRLEPVRDRAATSGIAWIDDPHALELTGRVSRGIGTPVPAPDIWGLALRLHGGDPSDGARFADEGVGDLLLSSVGNLGVPWRFVPVARLSAHGAVFTTVMPYRSPNGPVLVGARTVSGAPASASARGVAIELARTPWLLQLLWAVPNGRWRPFATVSLSAPTAPDSTRPGAELDTAALRFDPVLSPPPGAATYGWTRALREPAYRVARRG
ncbi:hypothetical protein ELQ90_12365 [Labedella phragmitis]|uniref:Phosphodiesterase n=1 Tax=Labedella phragmitis TaxID=2498849 RepID=A0A3S5CDS0_9MICO|nr:hypothetical protein [Labedella phragmitis]RWZ49557.1 hypothetical protein ELQ90_12365 [Labedella phragmitis]